MLMNGCMKARHIGPYQLDAISLYSTPLLLHLCGETVQHLPSFSAQSHAQLFARQDPGELPPKAIEHRFTGCLYLNSIFRLQRLSNKNNLDHCVVMWVKLMCMTTSNFSILSSLLPYKYHQISKLIDHIDRETVEPMLCLLHPHSCVNYRMRT